MSRRGRAPTAEELRLWAQVTDTVAPIGARVEAPPEAPAEPAKPQAQPAKPVPARKPAPVSILLLPFSHCMGGK